MSTNTDELKRLAEAATSGPWQVFSKGGRATDLIDIAPDEKISCGWTAKPQANAAYIAAANPSAILSVIEEVEQSREMEAHWRDQAQNLNITKEDWRIQFMRADEANGQLRKVEQDLKADNTTLRAELDKAQEALGWIEGQSKAFSEWKMSEETRSGIRGKGWDWVFAAERKVAAIQNRASAFTERHKSQGESNE